MLHSLDGTLMNDGLMSMPRGVWGIPVRRCLAALLARGTCPGVSASIRRSVSWLRPSAVPHQRCLGELSAAGSGQTFLAFCHEEHGRAQIGRAGKRIFA